MYLYFVYEAARGEFGLRREIVKVRLFFLLGGVGGGGGGGGWFWKTAPQKFSKQWCTLKMV